MVALLPHMFRRRIDTILSCYSSFAAYTIDRPTFDHESSVLYDPLDLLGHSTPSWVAFDCRVSIKRSWPLSSQKLRCPRTVLPKSHDG